MRKDKEREEKDRVGREGLGGRREVGSGKYRMGKAVARYREVGVGVLVLVSRWIVVVDGVVGWVVGGLNNEFSTSTPYARVCYYFAMMGADGVVLLVGSTELEFVGVLQC